MDSEKEIMFTACLLAALDALYRKLGITDIKQKKELQDTFARAYGDAWGQWIVAKTNRNLYAQSQTKAKDSGKSDRN
jgi:hypothetical protein